MIPDVNHILTGHNKRHNGSYAQHLVGAQAAHRWPVRSSRMEFLTTDATTAWA